jgi:hypothetical protein
LKVKEKDLRGRRIANEYRLLGQLAVAQPAVVGASDFETTGPDDCIGVTLGQTCGILRDGSFPNFVTSHFAHILFPRFFPSVPLEIRLMKPVFHPNVDPVTGFVCLWERYSAGDTAIEALRRLQQIIVWKLVNLDSTHVMQPDAASWYASAGRGMDLPLRFTPISLPTGLCASSGSLLPHSHGRRSRLSRQ